MSSLTFQAILNATMVDPLEAAGSEVADRNIELVCELYNSSGDRITFQTFLTQLLGKCGNWFFVEGDVVSGYSRITRGHSYGRKWSRFLDAYLTSAYGKFSK